MKDFIKWMDNLPLIIKVIFALPALDIIWGVYRIARAYNDNSQGGLILYVILLIIGLPFLWIIDLLALLLKGEPAYIPF